MNDVAEIQRAQEERRMLLRAKQEEPMTATEFLHAFAGVEGRWELVDGVPIMMAGGTVAHGRISKRILIALENAMAGGPCEPFGSDVGVITGTHKVRYPDVSIICDRRDLDADPNQTQAMRFPAVVFEVLSPSTAKLDRGEKLEEYKAIASISTIVIVDPGNMTVRVMRRSDGSFHEEQLGIDNVLIIEHPPISMAVRDMFGAS